MFHKRLTRLATTGLLAGLLTAGAVVGTTAGPASAGPASAGPASAGSVGVQAGCRFELVKVTANELQENRHDEIYLRIGDEYTKTVTFREGETKFAPDFGTAAQTTEFIPLGGRISVGVGESDFPSGDELLGTFSVDCGELDTLTATVTGFGSNYDIVYDVVPA
jgi:hypothetical protein